MEPEIRHRLSGGVTVEELDGGLILSGTYGRIALETVTPGQRAVISALAGAGAGESALCDAIACSDGIGAIPWVYLLLTRAGREALVEAALSFEGTDFAVLMPFSRNYQVGFPRVPRDRPVRLSRFAYLRPLDGWLALESPEAHARLELRDPQAATIVASLARTRMAGEASADQRAPLLLSLLAGHGFLEKQPDDPEETLAREEWEFHDLLFHGRSRAGRHLYPWGATYRWVGAHDPLPAVKRAAGDSIALYPPDLDALRAGDPPFAEVLEVRRSRRLPGPEPLTLDQLGELLFRSARVRARARTEQEEVSSRPYPGGGADYELEIYPVVHRVAGLASGVYYYHPLEHALYLLGDRPRERVSLLRDAAQKARLEVFPDVLLCLSARFRRLSFKYSSIAYAVMLKDVGALYQTFYLAATAMRLAPCALGGGDIELFARATGLSPMIEPSVGEFMLSAASEAD